MDCQQVSLDISTEQQQEEPRLLLVDDEPAIIANLPRWLEVQGYQTTTATNGEEALALAEAERFDLVLTDIQMPGIDGIALATRLMARDPDLPIILITGYADLSSARKAIKMGCYDYFSKPLDLEDMGSCLQRAVEYRRLRLASRAYQESLEARIEEQTQTLRIANEDLKEEIAKHREVAEELDNQRASAAHADRLHALGEMAAGVAHELNQPLAAVSATAERIVLGIENGKSFGVEQMEESAQDILALVDRMSRVINHMQVFARDRSSDPPERFAIEEVVDIVLKFVGAQLKAHGIITDIAIDPDLPDCSGRPQEIEEVLLNLITNARYALDERASMPARRRGAGWEPRLMIRAHKASDGVAIEVEDTGWGIDEDVLPKVFDPFFTTKKVGEGTGLGLSVSHGIIENHGGQLWVDSRPGEGATFTILLPADGNS